MLLFKRKIWRRSLCHTAQGGVIASFLLTTLERWKDMAEISVGAAAQNVALSKWKFWVGGSVVTKTNMSKRCSVPHQMKPHKAGEQFQRKRMGEHYMLSRMFSDYWHFPQHHISSFLSCELFCPVSLNIVDCQQHGPDALLLKLENPKILLCYVMF